MTAMRMEHWLAEDARARAAGEARGGRSASSPEHPGNRLLRQLAGHGFDAAGASHIRSFRSGDTWPATKADVHEVVFPVDAVGSLVQETMDGRYAALALVGCEGLWDPHAFAQEPRVGRRVWISHAGGEALAVSRAHLIEASTAHPAIHRLLCQWDRVLLDRVAQSALCNRHHDVTQQVATWLLLHQRRYRLAAVPLTQTTLARVLGLRRESVSRSIGRLALSGAVYMDESRLAIASTPRLKACACECYMAGDAAED